EWRKERGILMFEDCALSLLSKDNMDQAVGTFGDAAAFSFHKYLPVPEAGALTWKTDWQKPSFNSCPNALQTARQSASLIKNWVKRLNPLKPMKNSSNRTEGRVDVIEELPKHYYFDTWRIEKTCSNLAKNMVQNTDWDLVAFKRRENYLLLVQLLKSSGFLPLYPDLPSGVVPLNCPILVPNRDRVVDRLAEEGIVSTCWWSTGHKNVNWENFPNARMLKQNLLPLPVHHLLGANDLERIVKKLEVVT
ncbi:MAG: DegT/DnrJ/EryC1/StrS family aminotransferase, partial [Oceanospirillaceae bacterium]